MCLDVITDPKPNPKAKGIGWKTLCHREGRLTSLFFYGRQYLAWCLRGWKWSQASRTVIAASRADARGRQRYRAGIHVFRVRNDARAWQSEPDEVVRRIEWQGLICRGTQEGNDVLVVERARLLKEKP